MRRRYGVVRILDPDGDAERACQEILGRKMTSAVSMYVEALRAIEQLYGLAAVGAVQEHQMRKWVAAAAERRELAEETSLRAYCGSLEEGCRGSHLWEKLEESETRQAYRFTRCLWAELFRSLNAEDIGVWICEADGPVAAAFNPGIRFQRTKTLMEGDDCCDHIYYVEADS